MHTSIISVANVGDNSYQLFCKPVGVSGRCREDNATVTKAVISLFQTTMSIYSGGISGKAFLKLSASSSKSVHRI